MERKGLSDVISTVLIVLLALAAIAIVWAFISPSFRSAGDKVEVSSKSVVLSIVASSVVIDENANRATLVVQREAGSNDHIVGFITIFESPSGQVMTNRINGNLQVLGTSQISNFDFSTIGNLKRIRVVPIYKASSGAEINGDPTDVYEIGGSEPQTPSGPVCGNNIIEGGEVCDGSSFGGQTCGTATASAPNGPFPLGSLTCNSCTSVTTPNCHKDVNVKTCNSHTLICEGQNVHVYFGTTSDPVSECTIGPPCTPSGLEDEEPVFDPSA